MLKDRDKQDATEGRSGYITIKGARSNNLKNIDLEIPRNRMVVITGLSGSGKSSLAFDTLYAEGQRRYVESMSSYARQFLGRMSKPDVDYIHGLSPAVAIEQKVNSTNPRSTVGTQTEIYEYLKLLYARIGRTFSPISGREVKRHTVTDVVDHVLSLPEGTRVLLLAPVVGTEERPLHMQLDVLRQEGYVRILTADGVRRIEDFLLDQPAVSGDVQLVIDRVEVHAADDAQMARLAESVQSAFFEGRGSCCVRLDDGTSIDFSNRFEADGITFEKPNENFFSFNNPYGACSTCQGYGNVMGIAEDLVVPNKSRSIYDDAVVCWNGDKMREWKREFIKHAEAINFPIHKPYFELTDAQRALLWRGDNQFPGIDGFFKWVESQSYKIQYRVMLARYRGKTVCPVCHGHRLRPDAEYVHVAGKSITEVVDMSVNRFAEWVDALPNSLSEAELAVTERIRAELSHRSAYLIDVGLSYLTLSRTSNSLSGGESQRINLASSLGSPLVGSMYILDEPSIGLHSRDTERLIDVLRRLRDAGNTVVVVEHDEDIIRAADYLIDIGPAAGSEGGRVVFAGSPDRLPDAKNSFTADYLLGRRSIDVPTRRRMWRDRISIHGAYCNNLKHVDVDIPLGVMTVVTGVSGSGKTSLIKRVLCDVLQRRFEGNNDYEGMCRTVDGDVRRLSGIELVDQNPIGRSTRSNPATYMKVFDDIRTLYSQQPLAKARGYKSGFFSFNVEGGRCEECQGEGEITVSMQFMSDVHLRCEACHGQRYKDEALEVLFQGKNISQVLDMTVEQAMTFFDTDATQHILTRMKPLYDVGLGYLRLGQASSSLSGGECQRIKLASYLLHGENEKPMMFVFDEPSTGLHVHDIGKLLAAFDRLIERGHTIVVVEHHHDIIKVADWVIDMGPEGGDGGGNVVYAGVPEGLVKCKQSYTAKYLKL
ncbi:MAG: excinuclease ABC subunit UvrA [Bacteroidales bacterium]|nr:excinuclease ABC subunit UvrA [Bacteroidales bacterium]